MPSQLFTPLKIGGLEIENRISVSPMCQYSAIDGSMTDWHLQHLMNLSLSGAGLLVVEATHVTPEGRITAGCSGLYSDENEAALARVIRACREISPIRIGLQIAHAGRKGSALVPWEGGTALPPEKSAWTTLAPSAIPLGPNWPAPQALDRAGMERIKRAFVDCAKRALNIGFDLIEMHSAHGYLMNQFLSTLANKREDEYGGPIENRMRYPLELTKAVRDAWPNALGARIPGSEYVPGGWGPDDSVIYARELKRLGCDYVTMSGGGVVLDAKVPLGPGYQVPFAEKVRREVGIVTCSVGLITEPLQAEAIVAEGKADFVALARGMLFNPRWAWHAAAALGAEATYPPQYARCAPKLWPPAAQVARAG